MEQSPQTTLYISPEDALSILDTIDCTVTLNIAVGPYQTHRGVSNDLVYVKVFGEYVNVHNIKSIQTQTGEFAEIDWSTPGDTTWAQE